MLRYLLRRIIQMAPVMLAISIVTFALMSIVIGDPVLVILGQETSADQQTVDRMREDLGLDRPLPVQYLDWLSHVVVGDLGQSMRSPVSVLDTIQSRLPVTLQLTFMALTLALAVSIPLGIAAARRPGSLVDVAVSASAAISLSMPNFWLGIILIYVFALKLGWLPSGGFVPFRDDPLQNLKLMILPTLTLATGYIGSQARFMRSTMLDVLGQDYVRTARAKGLVERTVVRRHAARNAVMPMATIVGIELAGLFGGAVVTETIFSLPGVGTLLIQSVAGRDITMVQGVVLFITVAVVIVNLLTDLAYALLDPRIRATYG
jgi:peptide/nickel transport system permease protein